MLRVLGELRLPGAPRWFWPLVLLALTAPFWSLSHPLIEVDDARYAEIPREMVLRGDWITPHLNEFAYVEKPPLWYWLCAASYSVFGVSEAAARLPLALLSLLTLLGTAWLGSWLYDPRRGWTAAAILGSTLLFFGLSHCITPDSGLTVWLLWCTAFQLRALLRPEDAGWAAPAAWACAALAFLSKGLVGLVFPAAWASLALLDGELRPRLRAFLRPAGPLLFLLIAAPWFLVMEHRHPGFLRFFFYEHHVLRFATQKFGRDQPWFFYLLVLPAAFLPWTPAGAAALARVLPEWRGGDRRSAALAAWVLLVAAFFSKSHSKLITYILPVFPHLALLAAGAVSGDKPAWTRRLGSGLGWALLIASAAALLGAPSLKGSLPPLPEGTALLAAGVSALLGAALLCWSRDIKPLLTGCAAGLLVGALGLFALRAGAPAISARDVAAEIASRRGPDDLVYTYSTYLHGLPFYTGRRVDKMILWQGELEYAARDPRVHEERFGGHSGTNHIRALPLPGRRVWVVCRRRDAAYLLSLLPPEKAGLVRDFGRWVLVAY